MISRTTRHKCILVVCGCVVPILVLELFTIGLNYVDPPPIVEQNDFLLSRPLPYQDIPYDWKPYEKFLLGEYGQLELRNDDDFRAAYSDFSSPVINVKDDVRATAFQPEQAQHDIYLFGGSTMFCIEVPDAYTVASYLQKKLNENSDTSYRVHNLGVSGRSIRDQFNRLKSLSELDSSDIVIYFDGVNEIFWTLFFYNPAGNPARIGNQDARKSRFLQKVVSRINASLGQYSHFIDRFAHPARIRQNGQKLEISDELIASMEEEYTHFILQSHQYCQERGVQFLHFLQPQFFSLSELTEYEKELQSDPYRFFPQIGVAFETGYPYLAEVSRRVREQGVLSFDISSVFDRRTQEIFFDWGHVNHHGNELIAEEIYQFFKSEMLQD